MEHLTFDELLKYSKRTIKIMSDEFGNIKEEYKQLRDKINNHIDNCPNCKKMLIKLQETESLEEIDELRNKFESKKEEEKITEEEKISKQYGISLDNIEHIKSHDGKEYYHFFDVKLNKDVILKKNDDNKNMSEELKEVQENISVAQGEDEKTNGEEAFRYQRMHTNNEVKLYDVNQIIENPALLGEISKEQMKVVSVLLKNKDILKIKQINLETGIGIDENHKVITAYYNEKSQKYEVNTPTEYQYKTEKVSIHNDSQAATDDELDKTLEITNDMLEEIDGVLIDQERVKLYYEYPELLDRENMVSEQEKIAYMKAVENYKQLQEKKQSETTKDKPKVLVLKDKKEEEKQAGYIDAILLALTTGFAGGVITTIMLGIIN